MIINLYIECALLTSIKKKLTLINFTNASPNNKTVEYSLTRLELITATTVSITNNNQILKFFEATIIKTTNKLLEILKAKLNRTYAKKRHSLQHLL